MNRAKRLNRLLSAISKRPQNLAYSLIRRLQNYTFCRRKQAIFVLLYAISKILLMNNGYHLTRLYIKGAVACCLLILLAVRCGGCSDNACFLTKGRLPATDDTIIIHSRHVDRLLSMPRKPLVLKHTDGTPVKNKIRGVGNYKDCFPDMNDVQLATAQRLGISQIADREEAQRRKKDLVYINDNAFYRVQHLSHSIPYLVPRAQRLLNEISRCFIDSLQRKGYPFHKIIVSSVLRTDKDVTKLRRVNSNASENSCHRFGTTFDICYNCFYRVADENDKGERRIYDGRLKDILSEVLRDQRMMGTCYVRYESRQACFHITAR